MKKYRTFPVEYDFKRAELDLIDQNTGKIKDKYKCLLLMITLPLSSTLNSPGTPIEPVPEYKQTILKSTTSNNGWLNFIPIENTQPNIIIIQSNYLYFSNLNNNYDITVDIVKKGKDDVDLRFMAENPTSRLASNMNDINLDEVVFSNLSNNDQFNFTVTGEYEFFYINYPTTDFDINITVNISATKTPTYISDHKCKKCTCFDLDGNGYIRLKDKEKCIFVPVYTSRIYGNTITKYLYPEFNYLRDAFYNITLANSLPPPTVHTQKLQINQTKAIIKEVPDEANIIRCGIIGDQCSAWAYWCYYQPFRSGNLLELQTTSSNVSCKLLTVIKQNINFVPKPNYKYSYRYEWDKTKPILISNEEGDKVKFVIRYHYSYNNWPLIDPTKSVTALKTLIDGRYYHYLPAGEFIDSTAYQYTAFDFIFEPQPDDFFDTDSGGSGALTYLPENKFNIRVTVFEELIK